MGEKEKALFKQLKTWSIKDISKSYGIKLQKPSDIDKLFELIKNDLNKAKEQDNEERFKYWRGYEKPKKIEKRYSVTRIRKILQNTYGCYLINTTGYKGNRFKRNTYKVSDIQTGTVIFDNCTLSDIGMWLVQDGSYE